MPLRSMRQSALKAAALSAAAAALFWATPARLSAGAATVNPGSLTTPKGICPLKHTSVKAKISGPLARVTVRQEFENPFSEKIEAVYTFPLPPDAAVDNMTMLIGDRTIRRAIKEREDARKIYENARRNGNVASLLDQERPNIFTQAVANIMPGAKVEIEISYVETVPYEAGSYEFNFPMAIAPRYIPGVPTGKQGGGWAPDTNQVPDASRITPPVTPEGTRAGHDISLEVAIDAGVPITSLASKTHDVEIDRGATSKAVVRLRDKSVIPNKDFILKYAVGGNRMTDALLTHRTGTEGYFTLLLQPPNRVAEAEATPKELVFVLDTSGSMMGFPIEKAKEAMRAALDQLSPRDTFNLITFSGDTRILFPAPVAASAENLRIARNFLDSRSGSGGTEMMKAIRAALDPSDNQDHVRVVCFMTDGAVGNDYEIIGEVKKHPNARVFAFGIGSSVNRYLLDNIAKFGRGEVEYVGLRDDGSAAARRFAERVRTPVLTDISIDWGGLPVVETFPAEIPDLFAAKPIVISGKYSRPAGGVIRINGKMAGRGFTRELRVDLPESQPADSVLSTLWARRKVADLMSQDFRGLQGNAMRPDLKQEITKLGIDYRLMTPHTSFVAVEERIVTEGGEPRRVDVPVEMPEGMSYEGIFGSADGIMAGGMAGGMGGAIKGRAMFMSQQVSVTAAVTPIQTASSENAVQVSSLPMEIRRGDLSGVLKTEGTGAGAAQAQPASGKLDRPVAALISRVESGRRPGVDESRFVFGGEAYLRVTLKTVSREALDELRKAGFTITSQEGNVVTGRAAVGKVKAISELTAVQWIAPR